MVQMSLCGPELVTSVTHVNFWLDSKAKINLRSGLFWNFTQYRFLVSYLRFGTTHGSHLPRVSSPEDETDGLYQNFGKTTNLPCAKFSKSPGLT